MKPAIFLDRDGVLNTVFFRDTTPIPPQSLAQLQLISGVPQAIEALHRSGYVLIVVTNQPDIARGTALPETLDAMHTQLRQWLPQLHDVRICPHDTHDQCTCRKPKPGMLLQAAQDYGLDLSASYLVGDRWRDINCGKAAGCKTVLVGHKPGECYAEGLKDLPDYRFETLLHFSSFLGCF